MAAVRAAFLPDTFHEVNGVAHTSRQFELFARRHEIPFLSIHGGPENGCFTDRSIRVVQLKRGPLSVGLDANLHYDPLLFRYARQVQAEIQQFGADVIHITGPGDMGTLGCRVARRLGIPLAISWHTNLHEYAALRLERLLAFCGPAVSRRAGACAQRVALSILKRFYRRAAICLAPNQELVQFVGDLTGRPVFLMKRGVDTRLFSPQRRSHNLAGHPFRIGYVGRLTAEKNVRFLRELVQSLRGLGRTDFELLIVGEGRERSWLEHHLPDAILTGVLRDERLADAYASMDVFVFPSRTDTFGNVVLEAMASGVPAVVMSAGGPGFVVESGVSGFVAHSDWEFITAVNQLMNSETLRLKMSAAARRYACAQCWDAVFQQVFCAYEACYRLPSSIRHPALGSA